MHHNTQCTKNRQENKSLLEQISTLNTQIINIQNESTQQQTLLQQQIDDLTSNLKTVSSQILAKEQMLKGIANDSNEELRGVKQDLVSKDTSIAQLKEQQGELEGQIQNLTLQLEKVGDVLAQRETELGVIRGQMEVIQNETEVAREKERVEVDGIKSQFAAEKEELEEKVKSFQDELERTKSTKQEELEQIKERAENEKARLRSVLAARQEELEDFRKEVDLAQNEVLKTRQKANAKVKKQQADSQRFEKTVKEIAARDKKELKKLTWALETKIQSAQYNLYSSQREARDLAASIGMFENQIKELELSNLEQVTEVEERRKADELFYAVSKFESKTRMQGLVEKFQRRMQRRQVTAEKNTEDARLVLNTQFESEKMVLGVEKEEAVEVMRLQAVHNLETSQVEFDTQVMELNKQMNGVKEKNRKQINEMKMNFDIEMKNERIEAGKEIKKIIAGKDAEMKKFQAEADRLFDGLKVEMTQKLKKSTEETTALRSIIDEKDEIILEYEAEMGSFRQLAKLTWKVAKQKITKRRGR